MHVSPSSITGPFGSGAGRWRAAQRLCIWRWAARAAARCALTFCALTLGEAAALRAAGPLAIDPTNPHYLTAGGRPTLLVTSGEHYGAVLNAEFDFVFYLGELHKHGLNLTRTFSGAYREIPGSFGIEHNTLAPEREKFICPFARTDKPGAADGGLKFDLTRYNPAYFQRLHAFLTEAKKQGIYVELSLFCAIYDDNLWKVNPLNPANIVNEVEPVGRQDLYTLKHPRHLALQEAFVRQIARELKDDENVYFEICNEPYWGSATAEWNARIAAALADAEKDFPHRHLLAQNIANGSQRVKDPSPRVSIFNFHYATPPNCLAENVELKRPLADDETGFKGTGDLPYRIEAWDFLIAGGVIFSHLDYSFTPQHPDGSYRPQKSPGGGGAAFRDQMQILRQFVESFDFVKMKPDDQVIKGGIPNKGSARALVEPGAQYAIYVHGGSQTTLVLDLPAGDYQAYWLHPGSGKKTSIERLHHPGGPLSMKSPEYQDDLALAIRK
ncbi:MAG TPA: cellulase family glycosylhydrolase [Pirellulales bacterium]|jgi:hypothetical protein|nr:cellulase family glycosylhydrolase [Pirellulales bacterium]